MVLGGPAVVVVEVAARLLSVESERFGRVLAETTLILVLWIAGRCPSARARLAAAAAFLVVATVAPATVAEVALVLAVGVVVGVVAWRSGVLDGVHVPEPRAPAPSDADVSETATSEPAAPRAATRRFLTPVLAWLAAAVAVNVSLSVAGARAGARPDGRIVWDATNFIEIARDGYRSARPLAASFPGYAMVIRGAHEWLGLDHELASILISDLCGVVATVLFWLWTEGRLHGRARLVALGLFLSFPYCFVLFGVAYADGLLLVAVLGAVLAVERDHLVLAGLLGAGATFTRPNGLALVPALVVLVAERSGVVDASPLSDVTRPIVARLRAVRWSWTSWRPRHLAVLLSAGGIAGYMWWMRIVWHDPLYFWTVQTTDYGHRAFTDPRTWLKVEFVNRPWEFIHNGPDAVNQVASFVVIVAAVAGLPVVGRRFGWGYAVLGLGTIATLWVTATGFAPAGRYLLPYLPFAGAAIATPLARSRALTRVTLAAFGLGSLVLAWGFASVFRLNW